MIFWDLPSGRELMQKGDDFCKDQDRKMVREGLMTLEAYERNWSETLINKGEKNEV